MDKLKKPTILPQSSQQAVEWQKANYSWWQNNPMRYDWKEKVSPKEFTKEFYIEIDRRFFFNAKEYSNWKKIPFDTFINFESLKEKDVLEIGVGNGSHAQFLAQYSKSFIGIDITDYAVESTRKRMEIFGLKAEIIKMDAEKLEFNDNSFDFIWSWGVVHHSANTEQILKEIQRVLRPGGEAVIMIYHRGWWNYYIIGALRGIISGDLIRTKSLHKSIQLHTDGAIARYYSVSDWKLLVKNLFRIDEIWICGPKSDIIPLPSGFIKKIVMNYMPIFLTKFLTSRLKMGSFLVSRLRK